MMTFQIPILIIFWKRSDLCKKLIDALRPSQPQYMYLACDGWVNYKYNIKEEVMSARHKIESYIDWPCSVYKRYSDHNQGCRHGVSNAIDWFFETNKSGIILEEDCIPSTYFLNYCQILLHEHRSNQKIWTVCGFNPISKYNISPDSSYFYSRFNNCWGWATWSDRWSKRDLSLTQLQSSVESQQLKNLFTRKVDYNFWLRTLTNLRDYCIPDTWDYQWTFTILLNEGLNILPYRSLVLNEGFRSDATHTIMKPTFVSDRQIEIALNNTTIKHPSPISSSEYADYLLQAEVYTRYNYTDIKLAMQLIRKTLRKLKRS